MLAAVFCFYNPVLARPLAAGGPGGAGAAWRAFPCASRGTPPLFGTSVCRPGCGLGCLEGPRASSVTGREDHKAAWFQLMQVLFDTGGITELFVLQQRHEPYLGNWTMMKCIFSNQNHSLSSSVNRKSHISEGFSLKMLTGSMPFQKTFHLNGTTHIAQSTLYLI